MRKSIHKFISPTTSKTETGKLNPEPEESAKLTTLRPSKKLLRNLREGNSI